jgi:hypothetical protein
VSLTRAARSDLDAPISPLRSPVSRPRSRADNAATTFSSFCSPSKQRECTGKCRQFNGFGLVQAGSGPGGQWFKSTRPDHFRRPAFGDLQTDPSFTFEPSLRFVGGVLLHARQLGECVEVASRSQRVDGWSARKEHQPPASEEPPQNRFVARSLAPDPQIRRATRSPSTMNGSHTSSAVSTVSTTSAFPRHRSV